VSHFLRKTKGRRIRRGFPIAGYVGANGSGKTMCLVWDSLPTLEAGRPVLSTVRLLDYLNPRLCDDQECAAPDHETHMAAHPLWVPFTNWPQLMNWSYGDVLMDEVTGVASSRESHSMPGEVANMLNQLRHGDVVVRWSAPSWKRADIIMREVTQSVTSCKGFMKVAVPPVEGEPERSWQHRRLFAWKTYDANDFEDFTAGTKTRVKAFNTEMYWGPGGPAFSAYSTFGAVLAIGATSATGRCMTCGGRRSAPACSCPDYKAPSRVRAAAAAARAPLAGSASAVPPDPVEVVADTSALEDSSKED
jgi:Zonular occludens toxin (Zot)